MRVFFKRKSDFVAISTSQVLDYSISESIYNNVSSIMIETPSALPSEGDWAYLDEERWIGIITSVIVEKGKTSLKCEQAIRFFSREIFDNGDTFIYGEDYLKTLIDNNYTNCSDSNYSFPYLNITAATHTSTAAGPDVDKNVFTVASYASKLRRLHNIVLDFSPTRTTLNITIRNKGNAVKNIDTSNPLIKVSSEDFSEKQVGKITTYCKETTQQQNWYYWDDGSITSDSPAAGPLWALQHQDLVFTNVTAANWSASSTYADYPYKCDIYLRGVTANHVVTVTLDVSSAYSQFVSPLAESYENFIRIYSSALAVMTLPQVVCQIT